MAKRKIQWKMCEECDKTFTIPARVKRHSRNKHKYLQKIVKDVTILLQSRPGSRNTHEMNTCTYDGEKQETTPENKLKVAN